MTMPGNEIVRARIASAMLLAVGSACLASPARAQTPRSVLEVAGRDTLSSMVALGTRLRIRSGILHETREVIVATPPGYDKGRERFPVLYVLDGAQNLLTTVSASRGLAGAGRMPPVIVVAIINTQRDRDFTPKLVRTTEPPPERLAARTHFSGSLERSSFQRSMRSTALSPCARSSVIRLVAWSQCMRWLLRPVCSEAT